MILRRQEDEVHLVFINDLIDKFPSMTIQPLMIQSCIPKRNYVNKVFSPSRQSQMKNIRILWNPRFNLNLGGRLKKLPKAMINFNETFRLPNSGGQLNLTLIGKRTIVITPLTRNIDDVCIVRVVLITFIFDQDMCFTSFVNDKVEHIQLTEQIEIHCFNSWFLRNQDGSFCQLGPLTFLHVEKLRQNVKFP